MENQPPLAVLQYWGYRGDEGIALFPPMLLDGIAADRLLICDREAGSDRLAHYECGADVRTGKQKLTAHHGHA
ncbi:MAG: hypothetical protein DDG58_04395 [Ardenticatenia bacterium]|jgi:hypothetical protein|nr:MAG: hypothetical protein DDG58_04395 [Ardenticatenia bacterium]